LRILVLSTSFFPKIDGMIRTVDNQCRALIEAGHEVSMVCAEPRRGHDDRTHAYRVIRARIKGKRRINLLSYPTLFYRLYAEARAVCNQGSFDVCLAYGNFPAVCALMLKLTHSFPVIESITDISGLAPHRGKSMDLRMAVAQAVVRFSSLGVDGFIFPTNYLRERLEAAVGSHFRHFRIIPDGVDVDRFKPRVKDEARRDVVLYVGNLRKRKGLEDLVNAAPAVIAKKPDTKFVFVGEGLLDAALHRMVSMNKMEKNFEFTGRVPDEALVEQYDRASVYVVPTRFDGYPTSVLEAMAVAKPVITTKGSVSEREGIVVDNKTGFLFEVNDSRRLSELILKLFSEGELAEAMGVNARALVVGKHSLQRVRSELDSYLRGFVRRS
jgi:glycosyltransferase involved in cell wall biosynthesis